MYLYEVPLVFSGTFIFRSYFPLSVPNFFCFVNPSAVDRLFVKQKKISTAIGARALNHQEPIFKNQVSQ